MIAAAVHLVACMVVFSIVERLWPSSSSPRKWWQRPLLVDICSWLILPLAVGAGITLAILFADALPREHFWYWLVRARTLIGAIPLVMQIVIAFLVIDFLSHWIHRAYHRIPFLWSFHVMHNTSEHVDWLSTLRLHPISQMIDTALIAGLLLIAGLPLKPIIAANALVGFSAVLTHANVPWTFGAFGRLFVSPIFHHWHHARAGAELRTPEPVNFGAALSIWDRIFGTSIDDKNRPIRFGADEASATNLRSLLLYPLRFCVRGRRNR